MEAASGDVTGAAADVPVCKDGPAPSPRGTGDTNISSECISGYVGFFPAVSGIGGRSLSVDRKQGCPIIVVRGVSRDAARLRADLQDRNLDFSKCRVSGEGRLFDVPFPS